jgi:peptidoglycan/xylan/chitin deacetylase (PgdA/CDA1 family)
MLGSLRRLGRHATSILLHYSGLMGVVYFFRRVILRRKEACLLGFHRVLSEEEFEGGNSLPGMRMKERTLADLLEFLSKRFEVKPLDAILAGEAWGSSWRKPCCILTFDDGWRDNYTAAYRWLKRYGMPATIFLTTAYIDGRDRPWVEELVESWKEPHLRARIESLVSELLQGRLPRAGLEETVGILKRMRARERGAILNQLFPEGAGLKLQPDASDMMNWGQIAEMSNNGIEFGAHTVTHPLLTYENDETVEYELRTAKEEIETRVRKPVWAFAYPNGDWDQRIRQWVQRIGYQCAVTTQRGWHTSGLDRYNVRRILIHEGNVTGLNGKFSAAAFHFTVAPWR